MLSFKARHTRHTRASTTCRRFLALVVCLLCSAPLAAEAYSLSYSYLLVSGYDDKKPATERGTPPSLHQLMITDGYCAFIHQGAFNRVCFEGGPGFRFAPFAFDLHAMVTFHAIWFKPLIYGVVIDTGLFITAFPAFHAGLRLAAGFHLYFLSPGIEVQLVVDEAGRADARVMFQIAIHIPTASVNFALGNFGF